eukprot:3951067-Pleurochrysis_carterae.AAC.1
MLHPPPSPHIISMLRYDWDQEIEEGVEVPLSLPLFVGASFHTQAPQQRTDYVALLNEWAVGFYTELDFQNEASNMKRMQQ